MANVLGAGFAPRVDNIDQRVDNIDPRVDNVAPRVDHGDLTMPLGSSHGRRSRVDARKPP